MRRKLLLPSAPMCRMQGGRPPSTTPLTCAGLRHSTGGEWSLGEPVLGGPAVPVTATNEQWVPLLLAGLCVLDQTEPLRFWLGSPCSAHASCKMQGAFGAQTLPCPCTVFPHGAFILVCLQRPAHVGLSPQRAVCAVSACPASHTGHLACGRGADGTSPAGLVWPRASLFHRAVEF